MTIIDAPPNVALALDWTFPSYAEQRLGNGLRVLVYDCPGQFVIAATLLIDVPLSAEPRDVEGVAGLVGRCLVRGSAGRSAEEFADALALCGADLEASAAPDGLSVRLAVPTVHLADGLRLMADAVTAPEFSEAEFDHERRLRLQEIEQAAAYPQHVAVERLNAALFADARAARPVGGSTESVEAVGLDDLRSYVEAHFQPSNATLIIAGDFGGDDPAPIVASVFGSWTHQGAEVVMHESAEPVDRAQVILVDWPDAPQSTLRLAGPGIIRADERWPAMFVANFAVGGNFSSRINTVLREEKGFTYGASSGLDTSRSTGLVTVSTAVRSDATAEAVADIVTILRRAPGTITSEEVATAVRAATDSAPLGFERADSVAGRVEMLLSQGLPLGHVDLNLARIREVTPEASNAAYASVLRPEAFTVVVVGDAASVRESLAAWGYADVEEVTLARR